MSRTALHLTIRGRVQGVGYRWWTASTAEALGLAGWVRNRRDGTVEVLAIGAAHALESLAEACWHGPSTAAVTAVERTAADDDGSISFEQRQTV
ncbi:acylphosphatase [Aliidongia dinghuensis]|uniref:acylphosphatase n=1 Tax=Aliidongia dinghuensis TaxID=1867774 RepID=A0A8J2YXE9_9PROT|nr:acylphosphatase [Aliidongia dinghuensis]GGF29440.1 acylphosphatase [Aliidongia dinghuensis]